MTRTLLTSLLFAAALLAGALPVSAKPLHVVAGNNYPPYLYLNKDGRAEGYLVDVWKLWEQKTGIPVDLQAMQWSSAQQVMHDGQADVIDMLFRTPVREQLYDYAEPYATLSTSIYADISISGIRNLHSLSGMVVGVQRGDACVDYLAGKGISTLKAYPSYETMLGAARSGDIKLFCMDDMPANYHLYARKLQRRYVKAFELYSGQFHWAVAKGDAATLALVGRGMASITPEEQEALRKKWFSQPLEIRPYLQVVSIGALAALVALAAALAWIWFLRRSVGRRTAEISEKNRQLEQAARALLAEQGQLRVIFESSPDAMWLKDRHLTYVHCNEGLEALLGLPRHLIIGRSDDELAAGRERGAALALNDVQVRAEARPCRYEQALRTRDGSERSLEIIKVPVRSAGGCGVLAVARDITDRRHAERELRIAAVAFESQDGMMITDAAGIIERVNSAFIRISGYSAAEAVGKSPRFNRSGLHDPAFYEEMWDTLTRMGYWHGDIVNRHKNGSLYSARLSITAVRGATGQALHYVGNLQDISAEKQARALAERLRLFDHLTDLPNRTLLAERIAQSAADGADLHQFGAVMMLDLDHFQKLNDSLGHTIGDRLLVELTRRLQALMRDGDTLARFSGDSFVLLCRNLGPDRHAGATRAMAIAEAARQAIAERVLLDGEGIDTSASIGITLFHRGSAGPEVLLRQAELAMYKSKKGGRNMVRFFEDEMQSELDDSNRLERELRDAVAKEQLELFYQIQVDQAGQPIGAEALVRWRHPERGTVPPAVFIPLAEETGMIVPIGRWALATACRQLASWRRHPVMRELALAVNISPRQFKDEHFVDEIIDAVAASGAPVGKLKLEVTESLAIDDFRSSISKLEALQAYGFSISLDDFGTGNSSLNYLTKLPLTQLKIDKSFVDELPSSQRDGMVAQTIIAMGRGLGLDVIAEGVENQAQRDFLAGLGCIAFQGYLFGKPLPLAEFEACLDSAMLVHK